MTIQARLLCAIAVSGFAALAATSPAQALTTQECSAKYQAAKTAGTLNGQTWNDFRKAQCGADATPAPAAAAAPAAAPAPAPAAAPAPAPAPTYQPKPKPMQAARPTGAGQFSSEAEAKARCPADTVVWVNTKGKSHTYHYQGTRWYGTTKQGAYMCEADAGAAGYHASKSRTAQPKQQP